MGRHSRTKGAAFEREVAQYLSAWLGYEVKRHLGQARDGGDDLTGLEPWVVECKRRKSLKTVYDWLRQAAVAAGPGHVRPYVVVARADGEEAVAIMPLRFFAGLLETATGVLQPRKSDASLSLPDGGTQVPGEQPPGLPCG